MLKSNFLPGGKDARRPKRRNQPMSKLKRNFKPYIITLVVIACLIGIYVMVFMRPQPLMDCVDGTEAPNAGQIVMYEQDKNAVTLTFHSQEELADLWNAMQNTHVRFLRGRGIVSVPQGGAYYELSLQALDASGNEAGAYAFGCASDGGLVIAGSDYEIVGESDLAAELEALFADTAE